MGYKVTVAFKKRGFIEVSAFASTEMKAKAMLQESEIVRRLMSDGYRPYWTEVRREDRGCPGLSVR